MCSKHMHSNHQTWTFTRRSQAAILLFNDRDRISSSIAKKKRNLNLLTDTLNVKMCSSTTH